MKHNLAILLFFFIISGCSGPDTDEELLALDREKLTENLNYDKITFYKFAKIAIRSSAMQDTTKPEYQKFGKHLHNVLTSLSKVDTDSGKSISAVDALLLYKDYRAVKGFVKETEEDIFEAMDDLVANGVHILTLGQYLQPTRNHHPVVDWIHPDTFAMYKEVGLAKGLKYVESGPLVRSSYHAEKHLFPIDGIA